MNIDDILTLFITIIIIIILLARVKFRVINQRIIIHFIALLCIVFLFYIRYEKSAFMTALLYLTVYVQSHNIKEYFADSSNLPVHSVDNTLYPTDKILKELLSNNNLPSQIMSWLTFETFDLGPPVRWRDLGSNNHISFTSSAVKLNTSNNITGPKKWVSGDITTQLSIQFASIYDRITFIHLTRYNPRSSNRGKIWSTENGTWISGYNDNKLTFSNTDGKELINLGRDKNGDIMNMNIIGSSWNLIIDQMDNVNKIRTVYVNGQDYVFQNPMSSIPDKIGLNIHSGDKSDWDCAEIMVYPRIFEPPDIKKINDYFNKKYLLKFPEKIKSDKSDKYNIYNRYTFSTTPDSDWQSPPKTGSTTSSNNKLLGKTNSEYECVSLCNESTTPECNAFSYHMEKGACYLVNEKNILNHTTPNKVILSGTNKIKEELARKAKEEAERKAKEEAERKAKEEAAAALAAAIAEQARVKAATAAAEAVAAEQARIQEVARVAEQARQQVVAQKQAKQAVIANNVAIPWFNKQYYINVSHKPELNITNGRDFCIECWYYENSPTGNNTIVDKGDYNFLFQVRPNNTSSIGFYNRSTGWWYSSGSIPSRQWVHLAINYSQWNRTMTFYMNGNYVSLNRFGGNFSATNGIMSIGRQSPDSCNCNILHNATIFDLRIWNWFRSQDQIRANMNTKIPPWSTGLVANYMMTYRSDLVVYDETNRNHGYFIGSYNHGDLYRRMQLPYLHEDIPYDPNGYVCSRQISENRENKFMYGVWIGRHVLITKESTTDTGEKVYIIFDNPYTKMVTQSGLGKYYVGDNSRYNPCDWQKYSVAPSGVYLIT
jgi:hypothetical protein